MIISALLIGNWSRRNLLFLDLFLFFSPWFFAIVIYENLIGLTRFIDLPLVDEQLYGIDIMIFGETPSVYLQDIISPGLTSFIFLIYVLGYVLPPILLGVYIFMKKGKGRFSEYSHGITICILTGFLIYLLVPAIGPVDYYGHIYEKTLYGETVLSPEVMEDVQIYSKNTFPSIHTALSTLVLLFAFKNNRKVFYLLIPLTLLVWFSTIYLREHYFIDLIAGWILAGIAYYFAPLISKTAKKYGSKMLEPYLHRSHRGH